MRLIIFHHHLLPGGVTGVIQQMAHALTQFGTRTETVEVVCGTDEKAPDLPVPITVIPEIAYHSRQQLASYAPSALNTLEETAGPLGRVGSRQIAEGTAILRDRIVDLLLSQWGREETVWWVHNYHLGKNPAFTAALLKIATKNHAPRIVLHIHDFPECGRYANLRFLQAVGLTALYPASPRIAYATINVRDTQYLAEAGVTRLTHLRNPVTSRPQASHTDGNKSLTRQALATLRPADGRFHPEERLLLYPVRTIRRKNVFEAALITSILPTPTSLIVTLPGVSQGEKKYSSMVEHAFTHGTIAGLWGVGPRLEAIGITFSQLQRASDGIISSSVQEGFGYQYITALTQQRPLIARDLDTIEEVKPLFASWPAHFYRTVRVPARSPSLSDPTAMLRFHYEERIDRTRATIGDTAADRLIEEARSILREPTIDFSYLLPQMQYSYLRDVTREPSFRDEVIAINQGSITAVETALATPCPTPPHDQIEARYGLPRYAAHIERIADGARDEGGTERYAADNLLIERFAQLPFQRLLYE